LAKLLLLITAVEHVDPVFVILTWVTPAESSEK
jgi:hypothetical protein